MSKPPQLPPGWGVEYPTHAPTCSVLMDPERKGFVTIDWKRRTYALGYSTGQSFGDVQCNVAGVGWRDALQKAAIAALESAIA